MIRNIGYIAFLLFAMQKIAFCQDIFHDAPSQKTIYTCFWYAEDSTGLYLRFDSCRAWIYSNKGYRILGIDSIVGRRMKLTEMGMTKEWTIDLVGLSLVVEDEGSRTHYSLVDSIPVSIREKLIKLGDKTSLDELTVASIQVELASRLKLEQNSRIGLTPDFQNWLSDELTKEVKKQEVTSVKEMQDIIKNRMDDTAFVALLKRRYVTELQKGLSKSGGYNALVKMMRADSGNVQYIKNLIQNLGWIDVERFGVESSYAASVIIQHSGDPLLMEVVLPEIKKDCASNRIASIYSLMYYRMHLYMGANADELNYIGKTLSIY